METYIQMAMVMKLSMLKRECNPNFTYGNIESIMYDEIWKNKQPKLISEAVNDIMKLTGEDLVVYLSKQAIISARSKKLEDFEELLGGEKYE